MNLVDDPRKGLRPTAETYRERKTTREERARALTRRHHSLGYAKLGMFVIGVVILAQAVRLGGSVPWHPLWIPVALFLVFSAIQERVGDRRETARRAVRFYEEGLRRLQGEVGEGASTGRRFRGGDHPYSDDLDLFGTGSLFERVNRCATLHGEESLAGRLKSASPKALNAATVRRRQQAVQELLLLLDLREAMAGAGQAADETLSEKSRVDAWAASPPVLEGLGAWRVAAFAFPVLTIGLSVFAYRVGPAWPALVSAIPLLAMFFASGKKVSAVLGHIEDPARVFSSFERLAACLESQAFQSQDLQAIGLVLQEGGSSASLEIRRLRRIVVWSDALRNDLFAAVAGPLLLWGLHCAVALEKWRARCGEKLPGWFEALGEAETIASLAALAHEQRDYSFPEILDDGTPSLIAEEIGHPLLGSSCVPNTLTLEGPGSVLLVSGSNSSGKSTLLRSVGINAVLAMAGSVVRARRLALPPIAPATSMRLVDSLQEGTSHFVAEVKRLRKVMDVANSGSPVLFLLDEILQGTNARERNLGAHALIAELIRKGAIGLVTTHDLALADLEEEHPGKVRNVHFADHVKNGRMLFDFRMQPGVIGSTNALRLMKAHGLPVGVPDEVD